MTEPTPNARQRELIEATEGIHVVDAGAGTGKTFAITRRYANLLREGYEPEDVLLVTFTNNAATEMKERVVARCDYSMSALRDAPISTFHSFCHNLLLEYGADAPSYLDIDDQITGSTQLLENEVIEADRFRTFLSQFVDAHPEHEAVFRVLNDPTALLELIRELAAKGVFPTVNGWYRDGEVSLDGDFETFEKLFAEANGPNEGANGATQSDLRDSLSGFERNRCFLPDAPSEDELRDSYPSIDDRWAEEAFMEDREALKEFVHDVYVEYIQFALRRNYLNFSFLQLFAFVLLCEDHALRESVAFKQVMVDEFQDTSEIQFKLALLLAETDNFCVVGDWKQSIYGFQYAAVENIRSFERRLREYKRELNGEHKRVDFPVEEVNTIPLRRNYRSTQSILDLSRHALTVSATGSESVDRTVKDIDGLEADTDREHSTIAAFTSESEHEAILDRIETIVDNDAYAVEDDSGDLRTPSYDDIAVLTRTRRFGRELQTKADECAVPVAYEGGVKLFETDQAILLLAWLRILDDEDSRRGWAVVLEQAGYTLAEVEQILETGAYPDAMVAFRERLTARESVGAIARQVFDRYGYDDAYASSLVALLQDVSDGTTRNFGGMIRFIERSLDAEATHEIDDNPGGDSITVQTIHAAKGLEHPIVIVANVNRYSFPPSGGGDDRIRYEDPIGLRQTKLSSTAHGRPHLYDNWRYRVLSACLGRDYDEERRLLYVAMTRAQDHLLFSAGAEPSPLFENLPLEPESVDPEIEAAGIDRTEQTRLQVSIPEPDVPAGQSPHALMDDRVFEDRDEGRGIEFGNRIHDFAERYAAGEGVEPAGEDEHRVRDFIDELEGELHVEEDAYLPVSVGEQEVTISGVIDLLCVTDEQVEIVDYKTDLTRDAEDEYRKQLSVYYHVVQRLYPDRPVSPSIFYTASGERVTVEPHSMTEISGLIERNRDDTIGEREEPQIR
ncbi:ATP-dependent DNA helicase PcrA protein [Halorhabdus tiamatea SARL4B]|uniref:DNA 3'-5' helicase n=1 Tax=Halorhabdus tiamatea SARL4B TaxID=1033806 RepID=F7PHN1_9EURY|nr:ATP-dependent DNA helicase [Halorhabdus tiamatea]ERJ05587.1 ATP-dependent DNA helicase PcrA protein [Halorhabdus tiamatea SARL4B]CCQ35020.1 UvrD/REP helicase [Halorhabdus tiamatea SARL4B]